MEGWQEYQLDNEALDENCLLLNMEAEKLNIPSMSQYFYNSFNNIKGVEVIYM